ncbi:MAG: kinase/pyrophosphorylase [Nitrosomonadales bacterium]|nr:kinase/pyrophosphorylase [Nitrosomonadales bacterium]
MNQHRSVFFVSDRTGLTAEMLGRSLLSQFERVEFDEILLSFVDTPVKVAAALRQIDAAARNDGVPPLVFSTLALPELRTALACSSGVFFDLFASFIGPLSQELGMPPSGAMGRSHGFNTHYDARMGAVNYALNHDDGGISRELDRADVILVGVSRCGKTPTSLYLALQFGVFAANYPLVPEDFQGGGLPATLKPLIGKLHGLTIRPERLQQIREERTPGSRYASLSNCRYEVQQAEALMHQYKIPFLDATCTSVEEIATNILSHRGLRRH